MALKTARSWLQKRGLRCQIGGLRCSGAVFGAGVAVFAAIGASMRLSRAGEWDINTVEWPELAREQSSLDEEDLVTAESLRDCDPGTVLALEERGSLDDTWPQGRVFVVVTDSHVCLFTDEGKLHSSECLNDGRQSLYTFIDDWLAGYYRYPPKSDEEKKGEEEEASEKDAAGHFKGGAHFKCMRIVETGKRVKMLHGQKYLLTGGRARWLAVNVMMA